MRPAAAPKAILLDLDGTLLDTAPDLATAVIATMGAMRKPLPDLLQVRGWIGAGVERLLHRALTGQLDGEASPQDMQEANALFVEHYTRVNGAQSKLYPGVLAALQRWHGRGIPMACVTNKPERYTLPLIQQFELSHFFKVVFSGESLAVKKPAPEPLIAAAEKLGVDIADCLMVGDSAADVAAALSAAMPVAFVSYGYNQGRKLQELGDALEIHSFVDLEVLWQ